VENLTEQVNYYILPLMLHYKDYIYVTLLPGKKFPKMTNSWIVEFHHVGWQ